MTEPVRDWRTDWDHADPAWAEDPFAIWTSLREACPVARTERYGGRGWFTPHPPPHIPTKAIASLLALPDEDAGMFRDWVRAIMVDGHDDPGARERATAELKAYLAPLISARRGGHGDDVLTTVANAELDGTPLTEEMAVGMAYLLVVAGIDTTWSALGTAIWHLGTHPADLQRLVDDPGVLSSAV